MTTLTCTLCRVQIPTLADQSSLMLAAPVLPQPNDPVPPSPSSPSSSSASVLSQEQTLQLWTQIQQVTLSLTVMAASAFCVL